MSVTITPRVLGPTPNKVPTVPTALGEGEIKRAHYIVTTVSRQSETMSVHGEVEEDSRGQGELLPKEGVRSRFSEDSCSEGHNADTIGGPRWLPQKPGQPDRAR